MELKAFCYCFASIWSEFYDHGNICRAICNAGNLLIGFISACEIKSSGLYSALPEEINFTP